MEQDLHRIPAVDPVGGGPLYVSEVASDDTGIYIRGRFEIPKYARLDKDQAHFLDTFLKCRGTLNAVEKELGISYPTVRARLDSLLATLGLAAVVEDAPKKEIDPERKRQILEQLESGEIDAAQAKNLLRGEA